MDDAFDAKAVAVVTWLALMVTAVVTDSPVSPVMLLLSLDEALVVAGAKLYTSDLVEMTFVIVI